jgi:hypothetical protein
MLIQRSHYQKALDIFASQVLLILEHLFSLLNSTPTPEDNEQDEKGANKATFER